MSYLPSGYLHDPDADPGFVNTTSDAGGISRSFSTPTNQLRSLVGPGGSRVYLPFYIRGETAANLLLNGSPAPNPITIPSYILNNQSVAPYPNALPSFVTDDTLFSGSVAVLSEDVLGGAGFLFPARLPAPGITAYQAARAAGASVSDALIAARAASKGYWSGPQSAAVASALISAHQENEAAARKALQPGDPTGLLANIETALGEPPNVMLLAERAGLSRDETQNLSTLPTAKGPMADTTTLINPDVILKAFGKQHPTTPLQKATKAAEVVGALALTGALFFGAWHLVRKLL